MNGERFEVAVHLTTGVVALRWERGTASLNADRVTIQAHQCGTGFASIEADLEQLDRLIESLSAIRKRLYES